MRLRTCKSSESLGGVDAAANLDCTLVTPGLDK